MDRTMAPELVERQEELALLSRVGVEALTDGRFVAVLGEAGIGKTTLLEAARRIAGDAGVTVLGARASELERDLAFGVVRQLIDPVLIARSPEGRQALFAGAASFAREALWPDEGAPALERHGGPGVEYGLYWLMANLAQEGPLLVAADDLHWADLPSLRFLHFLVRRLAGLPIMVVATWRTGDPGPATTLISALEEEPGVVLVKPRPLSRDGIAALLPAHLGVGGPADLVETCHRASGGNPFYAISLLRQLAETGPGGAEDLVAGGPNPVARSVLRRLEALGPQAADLACAVAILGEACTETRATRLAGLNEADSAAALGLLRAAGLLVTSPRLDFAHPLVRSVVYDRPFPHRRGELHALAAAVLADDQAPPDDIALQLLNAGPGGRPEVAEALVGAAHRALERGAPDVAASFFARALREPVQAAGRVELLLALGAAEIRTGSADALGHLDEARQLADRPDQRAGAALLLARCLYATGRPRQAVELLHSEASGLLKANPDQAALLVDELHTLADVDLTVRAHVRRLGELASVPTPLGTGPASLAHDLAHQAVARVMSGRSAAQAAELAAAALADHQLEDEVLGGNPLLFITAFALAVADCYGPAERSLLEVQARARRHGDAMAFSLAAIQLGFLEFRRGNLRRSEAEVRAALETGSLEVWPPLAQMALSVLIYVVIERGQPAAAREAAQAFGVALDPVELTTQGAILLEARGHLRLAEGDLQGGAADLLRVGECLGGWEVDNPAPFPWRSHAGLALARLGQPDRGRSLVDDELVRAREWGAPRAVSAALRAAAQLAPGQDRIELLEEAVSVMEGSGSLLERAYGLVDLGAALRRANRRAGARPLLAEGLRLARGCDAGPLAHRAHTELWATGARPRTPVRPGLDALTASERRIADMASAGMSNPEIAQSLFVTTKTVEMHLTGAYRKLAVTNRGELARVLGPDGAGAGGRPRRP